MRAKAPLGMGLPGRSRRSKTAYEGPFKGLSRLKYLGSPAGRPCGAELKKNALIRKKKIIGQNRPRIWTRRGKFGI